MIQNYSRNELRWTVFLVLDLNVPISCYRYRYQQNHNIYVHVDTMTWQSILKKPWYGETKCQGKVTFIESKSLNLKLNHKIVRLISYPQMFVANHWRLKVKLPGLLVKQSPPPLSPSPSSFRSWLLCNETWTLEIGVFVLHSFSHFSQNSDAVSA